MYDAIKNFSGQLSYEPEIKNKENLFPTESFVVCGMGGSHFAADLIKTAKPDLQIHIHHGYGLPNLPAALLKESLIIISSYSGNTEETLDSFEEARRRNLNVAVITTGGKLLEEAIKKNIPYVEMPNTGIQPRSALGFSMKSMLALMGKHSLNTEIKELSEYFSVKKFENKGKELAKNLNGMVPMIYSSEVNGPISSVWKIKLNETAKIPAFSNVFSELNHNEMTGFDTKTKTKKLSKNFCFILLKDKEDDARIQKRIKFSKKLFEDRGFKVLEIELAGECVFEKIFSAVILADWTAYYLSEIYKVDSENIPMIEEFKKLIA